MNWLFDLPTSLRFGIIIAIDVGVVALIFFVLDKLGINIIGLPKTVRQQAFKNAFFTLLIMVAVIGAIAILPFFGFGQSIKNGFIISLGVIWVAIYLWLIFTWVFREKKSGRMLIHVTSLPNRWLFLVLGVISIITGFSGFFDFIWKSTEYSWPISVAIGLFAGTDFVIMFFSQIQIHENVILIYVDLIKWSKIESFSWVSDNKKVHTLKIRVKGNMPSFLRNGAIPVPIEKKEQLESILTQYLPEGALLQNRA
ncbi:MAG: hypothetical protein IPL71_24910 [Anaerolineales bacterium]|uniref:hypothetical protein n=1 Tax=Candidatus Villigracilis proximus TaxID=3140683 RepID=UPI003134865E|nr:hypothetical protein [Anaerolineales bacterium]